MNIAVIPIQAILTYAAIILITISAYVLGILVYRLAFSPLARFPGPRLAAATRLYETYFQMVKGGVFTWHIDQLHEEYGPIVRITPWELHIKDPHFYNTLYAGPAKHRNKDPWFSNISYSKSIFSTESHEIHRPRRRVLGQFFKINAIPEIEPIIGASLTSLSKHLSTAKTTKQPVELHAAFYCFTSDVISEYSFGSKYGFHYLERAKISDEWKLRLTSMFGFCRHIRHIPILPYIGHAFPGIISYFVPPYRYVYEMEEDVKGRVKALIEDHQQEMSAKRNENNLPEKENLLRDLPNAVYPSILADPDVPASEKELGRLQDDAIFLMMAATDAPAQVLAITIFHILNNPSVYDRLKQELFSAIPGVKTSQVLKQFENIPYLNAVVREGLRLSSVVTTRLPRSAPDEVLQFQEWEIPPGTFVSMSTYFILRDPSIFPEPLSFVPERWLLPHEELRALEKHLVPASKGTLGCLGQNFAWAYMHMVLGTLLRRYDLALHETTEKNVEMTRDNFIGQTDEGMNMIQVKVLEEYAH